MNRKRTIPRIRTGAAAIAMNFLLVKSPSHDTETAGKTNEILGFTAENILMKSRCSPS